MNTSLVYIYVKAILKFCGPPLFGKSVYLDRYDFSAIKSLNHFGPEMVVNES